MRQRFNEMRIRSFYNFCRDWIPPRTAVFKIFNDIDNFRFICLPQSNDCKWNQNKIHAVWEEEKPWSVLQRSKIDEVLEYKYLGVIIRAIQQASQDIFLCNYQYLCGQAHRAIFCAQRTTKNIEPLTPEIYFYLFDSLVRPILTYGSEVWGFCKSGLLDLDRVFLRYMRCILRVKATTSNFIVIGECGQFPQVYRALYHCWVSSVGCRILN